MANVNEIWSEKFSVGIDHIDDHHKTLLGLILDLQGSLRPEKMNHKIIRDTLNELQSYTKYHFAAEEKLMKKMNYRGLHGHAEQHRKFVKEVEWFVIKYYQNRKDINIEMLNFLKEWLIKHILVADKGYSPQEKGKA